MQSMDVNESLNSGEVTDDTFDRKAFVANTCMSLMSCLPLRSDDPDAPPAENEFEKTFSFVEMINYVATTPVILWDGSEMKRLSPGEAALRFLTDPDYDITMFEPRPKKRPQAEAPP